MKILITGGHITPAIAMIDIIREKHPDWDIRFVGRRYAVEGSRQLSEEYRIITNMGIPFFALTAGRWKRDGGLLAIWAFLKFPIGLIQALLIVWKEKPSLVLSFGGYVALPVVIAAKLFKLPIITHEQTTKPGVANVFIAKHATRVCTSFSIELAQVNKQNIIQTGLPIRKSILSVPTRHELSIEKDAKILFVSGGSTGSVSINTLVFKILPKLLATYTVIHQVGRISETKSIMIQENLDADLQRKYMPIAYLPVDTYSWILHNAEVIIGRAGANTVTEIAVARKCAIFIPLPWSANNEQFYNAKYLADRGSSVILEQKDATPENTLQTIADFQKNLPIHRDAAITLAKHFPTNGTQRVLEVIEEVLQNPQGGI
jgi:UDP-N-acetylglucosamine--N-acetylmuramyl-(pentapeptide) pyrophosphoryl-undecaprenol N-acetylglucosamine transferase